jgi:RNA polymerase sigma factor (sigma-70 family)
MIHKYTDDELIEGLRQRKSSHIDYLYQEFYPIVRHYLIQNSGNLQDVDDLMQDTMVVLYNRAMISPFKLHCSLKTYFISVSRNLWLQRLETKFRLLYMADCEVHEAGCDYNTDLNELKDEDLEQQRLFYKNLMQLPVDCRRLLQLYCLKVPYKEIARLMNYKDDAYVKTRKYLCKKMLRRKVMNDPEFKLLINYGRK